MLAGLKAPTEEDFYQIIISEGLEKAIQIYDEMRAKYPSETIIQEKVLNRIGSEAEWNNHPKVAGAVLLLNVHAYPNSAAAYENLAEADEAAGDKPEAVANYKKALALDPANSDAISGLKKLQPVN
ncbi:MAG TPA: hypothetical protein VIX37_17630 [Candidatus Sulfotelmatobacter sp.]